MPSPLFSFGHTTEIGGMAVYRSGALVQASLDSDAGVHHVQWILDNAITGEGIREYRWDLPEGYSFSETLPDGWYKLGCTVNRSIDATTGLMLPTLTSVRNFSVGTTSRPLVLATDIANLDTVCRALNELGVQLDAIAKHLGIGNV